MIPVMKLASLLFNYLEHTVYFSEVLISYIFFRQVE
jgi:hypothetical protein